MHLEVRDLEAVVAIAEEGSVTAAGERLHVTQSALSHRLRDAEDRLGVPLFVRLKKKMLLTPAGEKLLDSARTVLDQLHRVGLEIRDDNGHSSGAIRVSTECYTCYHWLPAMLESFGARYPKVEIRIDAAATHQPVEALLAGRLDVAIVSNEPREPGLNIEPLFEDDLMMVLSPRHKLAKKKALDPQDLADQTVLIYPPREESTLLNSVLAPAGVRPASIMELPLTEAIVEVAAAGLGVGFLARWAVAPHLKTKRLVMRPLGEGGFRRQWKAVTLAKYRRPAYMQAFIEQLRMVPGPRDASGK